MEFLDKQSQRTDQPATHPAPRCSRSRLEKRTSGPDRSLIRSPYPASSHETGYSLVTAHSRFAGYSLLERLKLALA